MAPASHELHSYTVIDETTAFRPISLHPAATLVEFLKSASYVALFFLVLVLVDRMSRLKLIAVALISITAAGAAFAIYSSITGVTFVPEPLMDGHWNRLIGTFVNRNHFAAHLMMGLAVALGMCITIQTESQYYRGWSARLRSLLLTMLSLRGLLFITVVGMFLVLLLNGSRGANAAFALSLAFALILAMSLRGIRTPESRLGPWVLIIILFTG
ncbi:MAG: hypothetical protein OEU36_13265, partial [Gammaproteobacteria bacterium]|nr:hypothetical protein [Gammaproteobacteria bacterium]